MIGRARAKRLLAVAIFGATTWLGPPGLAAPRRSPLAAFTGLFRLDAWLPPALRDALDAYEDGRYFAALAGVDGLLAAREPAYALDDALYLRALSLIALGWDDVAAPSLTALVDAQPPGPYYVPALLALVELHDRARRWNAVADAWRRYVDGPLRSRGARGARIVDLLSEFGTLRAATPQSTRREKSLLSRPKELAVLLASRRERPSDRLLYRSGLALLRARRHDESLRALWMVGLQSPYYVYARYSIAQDLFARGRPDEGVETLARLERYPKITPAERALGSRAQLLRAAMLVESGRLDEGIRVARTIADDDEEAPRAELLIAGALVATGKPSLAVVYHTATARPLVAAEAEQALTLGKAYASLGDEASAARLLRAAAARVRGARTQGAALEDAAGRVRAFAEALARGRRARERAARVHTAEGMRILLAHDGPWSFGTLLRRVRAALGAGPYRELALGTKASAAEAPSTVGAWLSYLTSPRRQTIERVLDHLDGLETDGGDPADASLAIVNAYLAWLEGAPAEDSLRRAVARRAAQFVENLRARSRAVPRFEVGASVPLAVAVTTFRAQLAELADRPSAAEPDPREAARDDAAELLGGWVRREIGALLEERDLELRDLALDLDVALAATLGGRVAELASAGAAAR